ncbi:MAG: tetratricopeptide repeat protein [Cyclobacteriaceae bacterium]
MTKYGLLLIVGYLFINTASFAQSEIDNLKRIVAQQKGDTIEIRALMKLGTHYSGEDISLSFRYFRKALVLAEKNKTKTSHINILNDLGGLYHKQGNYDSSLYFHRQALREATSAENSFHRADTYHLMGLTFLRMVNYDSARTNLAKGLAIATEKNYYTLQSDIYVVWGNTFLEEGNDAEALKKFIMAAKLQDSLIHDPEGESRALLNIANIQYKMGEMDKAIAYAREAQPLAEKAKFDRGLAYASQLLGRIYRKQKKFDESLTEYNKALAVYKRVGDNRSMAETLQNIGNSLFDKGSIQEAGNYYYDALKIVRRTGNPTLFTYNYSSIGYFHYSLKQYDLAIVYMDSSRVYAENTNDQYSVLDAYELLTLIKEKQGAYKSALEYHRKAPDQRREQDWCCQTGDGVSKW